MGSKWGTTLLENTCEIIYKFRRKHYVVFHEWIQVKCTNTSSARCRSGLEEHEAENSGPTTRPSANYDRLKIQTLQHKRSINLKDGLLFRKWFGETGSVKYYQFLIPKQVVIEVLRSLHWKFGKQPGITTTKKSLEENIISQNWRNWSGSGLCHVSKALENHELIAASPNLPCKTVMSTILHQKTPCKMIWCRNYLRPVAKKILWRPRMCPPAKYLPTQYLIKPPKQLLKLSVTSRLSTPTYHSEVAATSDRTVTPVFEKKLRWVKRGSLTKSWTHSRTPCTTSPLIATRSKLTVNFSPAVTGPRIASAVNWKAWNRTWMSQKLQRD